MSGPAVQFIVTPFLPEHQPALGVSSLAAVLRGEGISAEVNYLNLSYGGRFGWDLYSFIGNALPVELLLGELLFTPALWGDAAPSLQTYVEQLTAWQDIGAVRRAFPDLNATLERLQPLYDDSPRVVREWADAILRDRPRVVGFTSTFQQNIASLALARELRRRVPAEEMLILFGGANCEADMGRALADNFPFIDHVVSGEAEAVIVDLVRRALAGESAVTGLPRYIQGTMISDMNALPYPQFDDYFAALAGTPWHNRANLVAESSRGCWWGLKAHCTFCGLNGGTMAYRSKEPARFASELHSLKRSYGTGVFMLADNIMDMKYVRRLFPELASAAEGIELFYEIKANLRKEQLVDMAAGGVIRLQPGIESLSTAILKLMNKGTTRLQNLQLLKWCEELKVGLAWNLLFGFPGEAPAEYDDMAALIGHLVHLPAPTSTGAIRLDRFSPYWRTPESYGIVNLRPFWSYDLVYRELPPAERRRIAYFFDYDHADGRTPQLYAAPVSAAVDGWNKAYHRRHATLEIVRDAAPCVVDSRAEGDTRRTPLAAAEADLLKVLDAAVHRDAILAQLNHLRPNHPLTETDVSVLLDRFLRAGWVVREKDLFLSIVLDRAERALIVDRRVAYQLAQFGLDTAPAVTSPPPVEQAVRAAAG